MANALSRFWTIVQDFLQSTFDACGSLGDGPSGPGEVWIAELDDSNMTSEARRIGSSASHKWPVVSSDGSKVFALRDRQVIAIDPSTGKENQVGTPAPWRKLLGVGGDGEILGFLDEGSFGRPAILDPGGETHAGAAPTDSDLERQHSRLNRQARSYSKDRRLLIERSRRGSGFDVLFAKGNQTINLSDAGDDECGQPSLSPSGHHVVWIRMPRDA